MIIISTVILLVIVGSVMTEKLFLPSIFICVIKRLFVIVNGHAI